MTWAMSGPQPDHLATPRALGSLAVPSLVIQSKPGRTQQLPPQPCSQRPLLTTGAALRVEEALATGCREQNWTGSHLGQTLGGSGE